MLEDDDPIVDNNEIDTNNNLDNEWALTIPRTYRSAELRKWRTAPIVQSVYGRPGEMGTTFETSSTLLIELVLIIIIIFYYLYSSPKCR